jgi:hypothetical protein
MNEPSAETLKAAVQALYRVRAVEGPPGDDGQRAVWHLCAQGAELLSFVDSQGRVQRQELTLLDEHCVWTSGGGLRTGRVERGGALSSAAAVVHADPQVVSERLLRAAHALASYEGEDRYILHMKRVLALAREGIEMAEGNVLVRPLVAPPSPLVEPPAVPAPMPPEVQVREPLPYRQSEGLVMLAVLGLGLLVSILLVLWLL